MIWESYQWLLVRFLLVSVCVSQWCVAAGVCWDWKNRIRRVLTHNHTVLHCYQCNHVRTASALMILNHACSFLFFLERVSVCVDRNMCAQASLWGPLWNLRLVIEPDLLIVRTLRHVAYIHNNSHLIPTLIRIFSFSYCPEPLDESLVIYFICTDALFPLSFDAYLELFVVLQ